MKHLQIVLSLILLAHIYSGEAAQFTRLFFNNADCSGFHIAYNYMNSADAPTSCVSGCTEWSAGKFWMKEVCGTRVSPLFQEGFSVVRSSPGDVCSDDYSEFGALAETCILWEKSPSLKSIKMRTCPGGADQSLMITGYNGDSCVLESSTTGYSRICTYYSSLQVSYVVPQCPLAALPPAAPVAPPIATPVTPPLAPSAVPVDSPISSPVYSPTSAPMASDIPVTSGAPMNTPWSTPSGGSAPFATPISVSEPVTVATPSSGSEPVTVAAPSSGSEPVVAAPISGSEPIVAAPRAANQPTTSITKVSSAFTAVCNYVNTVTALFILICIGLC